MEKIKCKYYDNYSEAVVITHNDGVDLHISFCSNLDYYFVLYGANKSLEFLITKENYQIYECFLKLYEDIMEGKTFPTEGSIKEYIDNWYPFISYDGYIKRVIEHRDLLKQSLTYQKLVENGKITWISDDYNYEIAPSFQIIKEEDQFRIVFDSGDIIKQDNLSSKYYISVRICNSGSRYLPFNVNFGVLFNNLKNIDIDNQIHIEEYLYQNKLKRIKE